MKLAATLSILALAAALTGCASSHAGHDHGKAGGGCCAQACPTDAIAVLKPTQGNTANGVLRFTQTGEGVVVAGKVEGLTPNGQHAIHIHEFGDISSTDGASAGSHYNPGNHPHGKPGDEHRHVGDMGNLQANDKGVAEISLTLKGTQLCGMNSMIVGRCVIVHAKPDDFSQPVGNAGPRIAAGVIGVAKPAAAK